MTTERAPSVKPRRLTIITANANMAANVGGTVEITTKTFDLPQEISDHINAQIGTYSHVTFALEQESPKESASDLPF